MYCADKAMLTIQLLFLYSLCPLSIPIWLGPLFKKIENLEHPVVIGFQQFVQTLDDCSQVCGQMFLNHKRIKCSVQEGG